MSYLQYFVFDKDTKNILEAGPLAYANEQEKQDILANAKELLNDDNVDISIYDLTKSKEDRLVFSSIAR